jgi:hypothetical protein
MGTVYFEWYKRSDVPVGLNFSFFVDTFINKNITSNYHVTNTPQFFNAC